MDHTVTALTAQKKNPQRINVFLDGEFAFGLQRIVAAWLSVGQQLSDEKINQLRQEDQQEIAYQKGLKLLSFRMHSEAEIIQKLQKQDIPEENIENTIRRLKHSGLIDDTRFAGAWVDNRKAFRPRSRRALAFELRQRGISPETIDEALKELDEEEMAYQAALKRSQRLKDNDWGDFRLKLTRFLAQRGYSYEIASTVISRLWEEIHQIDEFTDEGV